MTIPMSCPTESGLQLLGAAFAIAAAAFWIYSARVEMPSTAIDELAIGDLRKSPSRSAVSPGVAHVPRGAPLRRRCWAPF